MYIRVLLYLLFSCLAVATAHAEVDIKGVGEITYEGWRSPNVEDKNRANQDAVESAVGRWASKQGESFVKNFESVRAEVYQNIDDYVLGSSTVDEKIEKRSKLYRIVVRVTLDDTRLKNTVSGSSQVASAREDDKSYMTFIFVSRRQTSAQTFDDKVYKREDSTTIEEGSEAETASARGVEFNSETRASSTSTTGGSTIRKADKISYDVAPADEINVSMSEVFTTAGFEVVDAVYLEEETKGLISVNDFIEDFRYGDDLSGETRRNSAKGARLVEVPFLAVGTLDIGMRGTDSASGLTRVAVTVTGKMISVKKRFPKTVAAVGPIQVSGLGADQSAAEKNALKLAAEIAAAELVNQLNAKGIK